MNELDRRVFTDAELALDNAISTIVKAAFDTDCSVSAIIGILYLNANILANGIQFANETENEVSH